MDMVEVFRPKEELYGITEKAIAIGAKVLVGPDRRVRTTRRKLSRGCRTESRDEPLPQDRALPPVLEAPA